MNQKYLRISITVAVTIGVIAALHFLVFGQLQEDWTTTKTNLEENAAKWQRMTQQDKVRPSDKPRIIKVKRQNNAESYALLAQVYETYELENPDTVPNEESFLNIIGEYKELEEGNPRVSFLKSMGVEASVTEDGLFGNGYYAGPDLYRVYPAAPEFLPRNRGTIEMWVSPRWLEDPQALTNDSLHQLLAVTRDDVLARPGQQKQPTPPAISLHAQNDLLIFEMVDQQQNVALTREYRILNWEADPEGWHFITITWDAESKRIGLFVDGIEARSTAPGTSTRRNTGLGAFRYGAMATGSVQGLPGYNMNMGSRTTARSNRGRGTTEPEQFPSMDNLDRIFLGSAEGGTYPAMAIIDDFRVSDVVREPAGAIDANRARELTIDGDTLFLNNLENEFINPLYLPDILRQMEGMVGIMALNASTQEVQRIREELEDYKAIFGVDKKRLNQQASTIDRFFKEFTAYKFIVDNSERNLKEIWDLFKVEIGKLAPTWTVILGFKEVGYDLVELALASGVDGVNSLVFLNQSTVVDQEGLSDFFERRIEEMEEEYPQLTQGGGMGYTMNPYMMYGMQGGGQAGTGYGMGMGMGMGMGAAGAQSSMMDFQKMQQVSSQYRQYKDALESGTIPPAIRAEYEQQNVEAGKENPYVRRILSLGVTGDLDAIASLLQALEYGDLPDTDPGESSPWNRLTTVTNLSLSTEDGDKIKADVTLAVHSLNAPEISAQELQKMMDVLGVERPITENPKGAGDEEEKTVAEAESTNAAG